MNQQAERSSNIISDFIESYFERRMARILLLGMISGFPWVLIATSLSLWLKEEGLSRSTIGWAGLIFGVYAFNYLWAPLIDRIQIPYLTKKIGHRRGWIVLMQSIILLSLVIWSLIDPSEKLYFVILVGLIIIFIFYPITTNNQTVISINFFYLISSCFIVFFNYSY